MPRNPRKRIAGDRRSFGGMLIALAGFIIFLMGASPELFGLNRSPVIGFVQITVLLLGLGIICIGGYFSLISLWIGKPRTIAADIGLRLVATGYVIAVASGLADVFGIGSEPWPITPIFGLWQTWGVLIGEIAIVIGFLLLLPPNSFRKSKKED